MRHRHYLQMVLVHPDKKIYELKKGSLFWLPFIVLDCFFHEVRNASGKGGRIIDGFALNDFCLIK